MPKDLYALLGLSRDASQEDVKKAYRRLSKEWHPDKHKGDKAAETKFKEINEAYEVLGNAEKRRMYDQFGSTNGRPGGGGAEGFGGFDFSGFANAQGGVDFSDIFQSFFGGNAAGGGRRREQGRTLEVEVMVDLADVLHTAKRQFSLRRLRTCDTCQGSGAEPGSEVVTCDTCGGTGQVTRTANSFFGQIQQRTVCPDCQGAGKRPKQPCQVCNGEGRTAETSPVDIEIPAGIEDGQTLRIRGQGEAGRRGGEAGDLFVHVRVKDDPRFERHGPDIRSAKTIPVIVALLGGEADIETLHGPVTMKIAEGTQPGQILRIKGKGLPVLSSSRLGDHYVELQIDIPTKLSRAERKVLEEWKAMRE